MTTPPETAAVTSAPAGASPTSGKSCIRCGYALEGLPPTGRCAECGTPLEDSLRGMLLQFASPEYPRTLLQGYTWVLNGILASICAGVLTFGVSIAAITGVFGVKNTQPVVLVMAGINTAISFVTLIGYLKLTEPDPQFASTEKPDSARNVARMAAIAQIVITGASMAMMAYTGGVNTGFSLSVTGIVDGLLSIASVAAMAVQFFAMMRFVNGTARRIPDRFMETRARKFMWQLPVLSTVGVLLLGLGPLIALILYWNLLDRVRKHLKSIVATGERAALPNMD
ncbi:MAG: hypothetical protein U0637_04645 [Phycisphaerales bacterium]